MEMWSFIISVVALLFSGFTFLFYDRKLKRQDAKINDYQLKQLEAAERDSKKAQIRGNIFKGPKGARIIKVYNCGHAVARNIRMEGLDIDGVYHRYQEIFPYELMNPQDCTELTLHLACGAPSTLKIKFIWDDESGKNKEFEQVLTL